MSELLPVVIDALQIAHDFGDAHGHPLQPRSEGGGGTSPVVILAGIVASLAAVGGLVWLKKRAE